MKKFLLVFTLFAIFMTGCSSQTKKPSENIKSISAKELIAKTKSSEDFSFIITLKDCSMCNEFYTMMDNHSDNLFAIDYQVELDKNNKSYRNDLKLLYDSFPEIEATPEIYIRKNNNKFIRYPDEIDDKKLVDWFKKNS